MRFATYENAGAPRCGIVEGDLIRPLAAGTTLLGLICAGSAALHSARPAPGEPPVQAAAVRLLPPLHPPSIRDFVAFEAHIEGVAREQEGAGQTPPAWYEAPAYYFTSPHACVGARGDRPGRPGLVAG
jgi:hypothetical protein